MKRLSQNPAFLMVKIMERLGIAGAYLKIMKTIYTKSVADIRVSREKLRALLVQNRKKTEVLRSPHLFSAVLEVSARAVRQRSHKRDPDTLVRRKLACHCLRLTGLCSKILLLRCFSALLKLRPFKSIPQLW